MISLARINLLAVWHDSYAELLAAAELRCEIEELELIVELLK